MSVPPVDIRRLGRGDAAAMRTLNCVFGEAFADPAAYHAIPPTKAYLERLLAREQVVVLTASAGGEVIGGLVAYELEKLEQVRSEYYIYDLAVAEAHRRRGIAAALIGRLAELAAARGGAAMFVQADYGDEPAIALYAKLGRREEVLHFDLAPSPEAQGQ